MTMKIRMLLLIFLIALACNLTSAQEQADNLANLSGTVRGGEGALIALHLESISDNPVRYFDGYESTPAADGSFAFTAIPPGDYRITLEANQIMPLHFPQNPQNTHTVQPIEQKYKLQTINFTMHFPQDLASGVITLHPGESRKGLSIELLHVDSICGHITKNNTAIDPYGKYIDASNVSPIKTTVTLYHLNTEFGILDKETNLDTDTDGNYKFTDLASGNYFIKSGQTWFPGTNSFSEAKPIAVVADTYATQCDANIMQLDNQICSSPGTRMSWQEVIIGQIVGDPEKDKNTYKISIAEHNPAGVSFKYLNYKPVYLKPDATKAGEMFATQNICPGDYEISLGQDMFEHSNVWKDVPQPEIVFDSQLVTLKEKGRVQLLLTPHQKATIEGDLHLDNIKREQICFGCSQMTVSILREGNGEFQSVQLSPQNHFIIYDVTPGKYQIFISTTRPDMVYVKSLQIDGVEETGNQFVVPETKLYTASVTLSGDLTQAAGHASPDVRRLKRWDTEGMRPFATVAGTIISDEKNSYTVDLLPLGTYSNASAEFTTQADQDGNFKFDEVPPGVYRLHAIDQNKTRFEYGGASPEPVGKPHSINQNDTRFEFSGPSIERVGTPLLITAGAQLTNLKWNAPQFSSLCGHIANVNGDDTFQLTVYPNAFNSTMFAKPIYTTVDKNGTFSFDHLLKGDFVPEIQGPDMHIWLSPTGEVNEPYVFHIEAGKAMGCGNYPPLELRIPKVSFEQFLVSGSVTGELPARVGDRFTVELVDKNNLNNLGYGGVVLYGKLDENHQFSFEQVRAGSYWLNVYGLYGKEVKERYMTLAGSSFGSRPQLRHLVASELITITDHDLIDLKLNQITIPELKGTIVFAQPPANWKELKPSDLNVTLIPHNQNALITASLLFKSATESEFSINAVDAGEYDLRITLGKGNQSTENYLYINTAQLNGKEINPRYVNIPAERNLELKVETQIEFASVNVSIKPDHKFPLPSTPLNELYNNPVLKYDFLLIEDPVFSNQTEKYPYQLPIVIHGGNNFITDTNNFKAGQCSLIWNAKITNIPPGKYYAIALIVSTGLNPNVPTAVFPSPMSSELRAYLLELTKIAKPITVHSGETLNLDLEDQTIETARIAAKVGIKDEFHNTTSRGVKPATQIRSQNLPNQSTQRQ
jgi:hypothetical protein